MSDNNKLNYTNDKLADLSNVTPKAKQRFMQTPVFQVIAGLSLLFLMFGYFSKNAESKERLEPSSDNRHVGSTLNQNLARLSALKEADEEKKRKDEQTMVQTMLDAQKQTANYTSTSDGKKIGNPAAYRREPREAKLSHELQERMSASTTFVNMEYASEGGDSVNSMHNTQSIQAHVDGDNNQVNNSDNTVGFAKASRLSHPEYTIAAGEMIEATLETAINSQLPGMVRAITTRDIYSLNAANRLIPKGSRLIGQYASNGIGQTQTRVLISWARVQLPNGIIATLNSPSTDSIGHAGLKANDIDTHFIEKFGTSILFSVLGAYTANAGVNGLDGYNSASQYRMGLVQSFQKTANDSLTQHANIPPTLTINQGSKINVFVARDLSFYEVMHRGVDA